MFSTVPYNTCKVLKKGKIKLKPYKAIGYWYDEYEHKDYPDPAWFVDSNYPESEKKKVIYYLQKSKPVNYSRGFSRCRICGKRTPGTSDLTDGFYIFPSGLVHYVQEHNLYLPDEFITRVNDNLSPPMGKNIDVSGISRSSASFDWWIRQKGIDPTKSSKKEHQLSQLCCYQLRIDFPNGELMY